MQLMSLENAAEIIAGNVAPDSLGVHALDDHTLEVRLTTPLPYFASMTSHATTFPVHRVTLEKHGDAWTRPENIVSNGAYVLAEHVLNERTVLKRNSQYWNDAETIVDRVTALVIPDENQGLTRYLAGELDLGPVPAGQFRRLRDEYPNEAKSFPRLCNYYYTFNLSDSAPPALLSLMSAGCTRRPCRPSSRD